MNGLARKLADADFVDYVGQYDVLFLSETWITNKSTYNLEIQDDDVPVSSCSQVWRLGPSDLTH